jgi:nucleoside-diphosphate-sugar epimerase
VAKGQIYNIQDTKAITFDGMARACAKAMGKDPAGTAHSVPRQPVTALTPHHMSNALSSLYGWVSR